MPQHLLFAETDVTSRFESIPTVALEEKVSFKTPPDQEEALPLKPNTSNDLTQIVEDDYSVSGFVQQSQEQKHEFYSKEFVTEMRKSFLKKRENDMARIDNLKRYIETLEVESEKNKQLIKLLQKRVEMD